MVGIKRIITASIVLLAWPVLFSHDHGVAQEQRGLLSFGRLHGDFGLELTDY